MYESPHIKSHRGGIQPQVPVVQSRDVSVPRGPNHGGPSNADPTNGSSLNDWRRAKFPPLSVVKLDACALRANQDAALGARGAGTVDRGRPYCHLRV
ncbi:hypothetical protein PoB_004666500 [Plakobranchus ocellatus]|uniref:Uncharacterized protein n=1 Tax=Plakobranchus ocellatus TaxID=259542 RepID=A0AAV4BM76_9GAST|nr:hypothetical protein PoB_004666500 [Plakobranchus ocellatus]